MLMNPMGRIHIKRWFTKQTNPSPKNGEFAQTSGGGAGVWQNILYTDFLEPGLLAKLSQVEFIELVSIALI